RGGTILHWKAKGNPMPSNAYFEELTTAVLMDADEVKGFLQRQSPQECQELAERMHERIVETFTKLLEVELEQVGKLHEWQERVEKVKGFVANFRWRRAKLSLSVIYAAKA